MKSTQFFRFIDENISVPDQKKLFESLRLDPILWAGFVDLSIVKKAVQSFGKEVDSWEIGVIALLSIGLTNEVLAKPVSEKLYLKKAVSLFESIRNGNSSVKTIEHATLLALALYERGKSIGSWRGIVSELGLSRYESRINFVEAWRTPLAILYSLSQYSFELLTEIAREQDENISISLINHMVAVQIKTNQEKASIISKLVEKSSPARQISWFQSFPTQMGFLVSELSSMIRLPAQYQFDSGEQNFASFKAIEEKIQDHILYGYKSVLENSRHQARAHFKAAQAVTEKLQNFINLLVIDSDEDDYAIGNAKGIFSTLPENKPAVNKSNLFQVPNIQERLNNCLQILENGEESRARELGLSEFRQWFGDRRRNWPAIDEIELMQRTGHREILESLHALGLNEIAEEYLVFLGSISKNNPLIDPLLTENIHQIADAETQYEKYKISSRIEPANGSIQKKLFNLLEQKGDWETLYLEWCDTESKRGLDEKDWYSFANAACNAGKVNEAKALSSKFEQNGMDEALRFAIQGKIYFLEGNHAEAKSLIQESLKKNSTNAEAWLTLAEIYQAEDDFNTTLSTLRSAVLAAPESNGIHHAMAKVCLHQNLYAEALPYLRKAIALNTENEEYFIDLIKTLSELGHLEESQKYLAKSRSKWPQQRDLAYLDAQQNLDKGNRDQALACFDIATAGEEKVEPLWLVEYAQTILDDSLNQFSLAEKNSVPMEQLLLAQKSLQKALILLPENPYAKILLAEVLYSIGEYEAAHSHYIDLTEYGQTRNNDLEQWDWRIKAGLGMVKLAIEEKEMGLVLLKEATRLNPEHLAIKHVLAEAYHDAKLDDEALHVAQEAYMFCATDIRNLIWYANFMKSMNQSAEVIKALENANLLSTDNPELTLQLAGEYVVVGNIQGALSALERILQNEKLDYPILRELTLVFLRLGNFQGAHKAYTRALRVTSTLTLENQVEFIYLCLVNNFNQEALAQIQKLISQNYSFIATFSMQAEALQGLNEYNPALQAYDQALHNKKRLNDYLRAKNQSEFFVPQAWIWSMEENEVILTRLASCAIKANAFEKSLKSINQVIHMQPENACYKLFAADISLQMNDLDSAKNYLDLAQNSRGTDEEEILKPLFMAISYLLHRFNGIKQRPDTETEVFKNPVSDLLSIVKLVENNQFESGQAAYSVFRNQVDIKKFALSTPASQVLLSQVWKSMTYRLAILASMDLYEYETATKYVNDWKNDHGTEIETAFYHLLVIAGYKSLETSMTTLEISRHRSVSIEKHIKNAGTLDQLISMANQQGGSELVNQVTLLVRPQRSQEQEDWFNHLLAEDFLPLQKFVIIHRLLAEKLQGELETYLVGSERHVKEYIPFGCVLLAQAPHKVIEITSNLPANSDPVFNMMISRGMRSLGNFEAALKHCEMALHVWPDEQNWKIEKAKLYDALGQEEKAITQWESVLKEANSIKDVIFPYLDTLLKSGKGGEAMKMLDNHKGDLSSTFDFHFYQSKACALNGKLDDALKSIQLARTISPSNTGAMLQEGQIWLKLNQIEKARSNANQVIQHDPTCIDAYLLLISVLETQGKFHEAIRIAEKALNYSPLSHEIKMSMAWNMREVGNLVEAINLISAMTVENEEDWEALSLLALLYNDLEDFRAAQECAKKSLRIVMDQPGILMLLGGLLQKQGHLDQALEYFSRAAAINPEDIEPCLAMGEIYSEQQNYPDALDAFQEAIVRKENDARPYLKTGLIMKEVKDYQGAEKMLRIAANLSPKDTNLRRQLAGVIALNFVHSPLEAK